MKTGKTVLFAFLVVLLSVSVTAAQEKAGQAAAPGPTTAYQAAFPITVPAGEYDLLGTILDFAPGARVPNHVHGGHVLVTVLSGEMTLREKGGEKIIKTGESWTENPGDVHSVVNAGVTSARVMVTILLPKGAERTTIVK